MCRQTLATVTFKSKRVFARRRTDVQAWLKQQLGLRRSRFRNPPGGFDAVEDCVDAARIRPLSRFNPRRVSPHTSFSKVVLDMLVYT